MNSIEKRLQRLQAKVPESSRALPYRKKRGNEYNKLLGDQNNCCAICNVEFDTDVMSKAREDHCHKTNKFRGFLCHNCNIGLGHFKDNQKLLEAAWSYLERFKI